MGKVGFYKGRHYTEYVDKVKELKRVGDYDKAVALLMQLIDAVEQEAKIKGWITVAPWYYEQLAIIHHKQKVYDAEVSILERFARVNAGDHPLSNRLEKARLLKVI